MKKHLDNLGRTATDKVSGFKGIITAVVYYLNGCTQYGIVPKVGADGKSREAEYFDDKQVVITAVKINITSKPTGGPQRDCPK